MIAVGPLWFVNLFLLTFFAISTLFIGLSGTKKLNKTSLTRNKINFDAKEEPKNLEFPAIIDRDLLNTIPAIPVEEQSPVIQPISIMEIESIPNPPQDYILDIPQEENEEFLPPLQITIRGTIISNNPKENRIFIENNRSKEEKSYMIGEIIEDSQIVFIGRTKAIFVRSNGQQETIYISKAAESFEEEEIAKTSWEKIIKFNEEKDEREIDVFLMTKRVTNVGYFLDELGMIVFIENGVPIGCKIGAVHDQSLAKNLGLESGDIILSINGFPTYDQQSRIKIYEYLLDQSYDKQVKINAIILRDSKNITLNYNLISNTPVVNKNKGLIGSTKRNNFSIDRSVYKKHFIDEQIKKSEGLENLKEEISKNEYDLTQKAGKNNALYRQKDNAGK